MASIRASVRRSRSSGPASIPAASAASTSSRLAASRSAARWSQEVGGGEQRGVLLRGRRRRQERGGGLRPPPELGHGQRARTCAASVPGACPDDRLEFGPPRTRPSGGVRPCRPPAAHPAGRPGALRPRRPGLTFLPLLADRRSPRARTLPPPVDDELVRQECDGRGAGAQGRVPNCPGAGDRGRSRSGEDDEVVAVDDLVRAARPAARRSGGRPPARSTAAA